MRLLAGCLAVLFLLGSLSCEGTNTIKVGLIVPLTGDVKTFGESVRDGALMAFEEVNASGGIRGRQVQVLTRDDANDPAQAEALGRQLAQDEEVVAILGSVSTACSRRLAVVCQTNGVPMVSPTSTHPLVTVNEKGEPRDYVFRACFTDSFQGAAAARFARDYLAADRAAVVYDGSNDYSKGLAGSFGSAFVDLDGRVVASEPYTTEEGDIARAVKKLSGSSFDVLFIPDYYGTVAEVARQVRDAGIDATLLGGDGWDSPKMTRLAGEAIQGGYFTGHYAPDDPRAEVLEWVQKHQSKYGREPDGLATLGYDAARLLLEALSRAAKPGPKAVRDELAGLSSFPGVTGDFTFDERGNPIKNVVVLRYTADGPTYVSTETP